MSTHSVNYNPKTKILYLTHRLCSKNLQLWFSRFQKFLHHLEKTLDKQIERLCMARYQQLIHGFHCNNNKPTKQKLFIK